MNTQTATNEVATTKIPKKAAAKAAPVKGPTIKLTDKKPEYKGGSARALWYAAVVRSSGKSADEFVDAATKKPPVLKKDGKAEHPAGWLRYFVKEGMAQLVEQK